MEEVQEKTKYCKFCGTKIPEDAVICTSCGRQVEELKSSKENIVINNSNVNTNMNTNVNRNVGSARALNKWVALLLCIFLGWMGAHKFYEGKIVMGVLYMFTGGLFGIGWFIDFIIILCRPVHYYV